LTSIQETTLYSHAAVSRFTVSELTMHTLSAIKMAMTFTDCTVDVDGKIGKPARIEIMGFGHVA